MEERLQALSNKKAVLIIALLLPSLILCGMLYKPLLTLSQGETITLATRPVDPTDLFRGDHVVLAYDIEVIPYKPFIEPLTKDVSELYDKKLYVSLKPDGNQQYHVVEGVSLVRPTKGPYLEARMSNFRFMDNNDPAPSEIWVTYGMDNYFVPENTGLALENAARDGDVEAIIKVKDGYGMLTEVRPAK